MKNMNKTWEDHSAFLEDFANGIANVAIAKPEDMPDTVSEFVSWLSLNTFLHAEKHVLEAQNSPVAACEGEKVDSGMGKQLERAVSALKVIRVWADFPEDGQGLEPTAVINLIDDVLEEIPGIGISDGGHKWEKGAGWNISSQEDVKKMWADRCDVD